MIWLSIIISYRRDHLAAIEISRRLGRARPFRPGGRGLRGHTTRAVDADPRPGEVPRRGAGGAAPGGDRADRDRSRGGPARRAHPRGVPRSRRSGASPQPRAPRTIDARDHPVARALCVAADSAAAAAALPSTCRIMS